MIIHKLEECPLSKQKLRHIVMQIRVREEFERLSRICRCDDAGVPKCGTCEKLRSRR